MWAKDLLYNYIIVGCHYTLERILLQYFHYHIIARQNLSLHSNVVSCVLTLSIEFSHNGLVYSEPHGEKVGQIIERQILCTWFVAPELFCKLINPTLVFFPVLKPT